MKLTGRMTRRMAAAAAVTGAAILLPAVALASSGDTSAPKANAAAASSAVHRCVKSQLTDWLGVPGGGAAGSVEYPLEISNISLHTCYLYGYPGVSARKAGGGQLGSAAARISGYQVSTITIAPGQTAHVDLFITDVGNYSKSACHRATAVALKVYAPGDFNAINVPFSFLACAKAGPKYLRVTPVFINTGIPGFEND
jgi:Protein of unknown function (DUF4232)